MTKTDWQPMETAPKDRPILVAYDHDADPYHDPATNKLTDYACHAEGGDYLSGKGVTIARWAEGFWENDGTYESGLQDYWLPACWVAWFNNDYADHAVNPIAWTEVPNYDQD